MIPNNLIKETSPYLLQHAYNPVKWYSWGPEALQKAKSENKPIFLSIGYSACHWCHVMAHESFENEEIAKIMNEKFVNIKVDREERPDIDDIYQKVCQLVTGSGGWPLSVFLTPDQKPFYVGTYFPILDSYGRPGFGSLLLQLSQAYVEKPLEIEASAVKCTNFLTQTESQISSSKIEKSILDEAAVNLLQMCDQVNGGFGTAPKFPNISNLLFFLRYSKLSELSKFQDFVFKTLTKMANGGIHDQVGGGFHRYSTDSYWLVPHFEKMLYDNALIPIIYAEAYQKSKDPKFLEVVNRTLLYVMNEMTSPEGGFFSSQDADSEGNEGKFYVWRKKEIEEILGQDADIFCFYYNVTDGGNFEGKNILNNQLSRSSLSFQYGKSENEIQEIITGSRNKLYQARLRRISPEKDTKILTSWNSLMISAFAKGYRISRNQKFLETAKACIKFIEEKLTLNGELLRTYKDGQSKFKGFLDDYAYFINALLDVFEVEADEHFLKLATKHADYLIDHFWDSSEKSFFFTADDHEKLIIRTKNIYDLSLPSGNSYAANSFLKLYHLTHDKKFQEISIKIMEYHCLMAAENPFSFGYLLNTIYLYLQNPIEITLINPKGEVSDYLSNKFLPESIIVSIPNSDSVKKLNSYAYFKGKNFDEGNTTVYVCRDFNCSLPLHSVKEIEKHLS